MNNAEMERLLGGYATNTLTEEERQALFSAALEDQDLFNALQDEEALRDLLLDAESRREIERALRQPVLVAAKPSWFRRPWVWGLTGSFAAACATVLVMVSWHPDTPKPTMVAVKNVVASPPIASPAPREREALRPELKRKEAGPTESRPMESRVPAAMLAKKEEAQMTGPPAPPLAAPVTLAQSQAESAPQQQDAAAATVDKAVLPYRSAAPAGTVASLMRAKKAATLDVTIVRDGVRLASGDVIQKGDVIRFAVRCNTPDQFTVVQDSNMLLRGVAVAPGQEVIVPEKGIIVNDQTTVMLMSPSSSVALVLSPGKPVRLQ